VDEGRDAGIRLAKTLAAKNTIESLKLSGTDLMGSRNVDEVQSMRQNDFIEEIDV